jgi:oxazoline/thiazoline synthase
MLKRPRLKYCYRARCLDQEGIILTSENDSVFLAGKPYTLVLSALQQGGLGVDELVASLTRRLSSFEIFYALEVLEKKGYLTEDAPALTPEACAYWNSLGMEVNTLLKVLQAKTLGIKTFGDLAPEFFLPSLEALGLKTGETGDFDLIFVDDYQREELRHINREALDTGKPWMLVKPMGVEYWWGPLFLPGKTGCWECLEQRLRLNRPLNTFYQARKPGEPNLTIPAAHLPASLQTAANLAAQEVVKWLYFGENERLTGKIVTLDTRTLTTQTHVLVRRPQCKGCGHPGSEPGKPVLIDPGEKAAVCVNTIGGFREVPPEETLEKYRYHISPLTGVVKSIKPYYPVSGSPLYNYSSGPNTALRSQTLSWLDSHMRSSNGGKGRTPAQAKAGALAEAIERFSMTYQGDEPFITASLKQLGRDGIHPNACMNFSDAQYREREASNRACGKFYALVPVPFDPSLEMAWTPVDSLTRQGRKYLPAGFCYTQYPAEDELRRFSYPDSSGCAAGNSLPEAILQGFLELVERDSTALWWYNRLRKPALDLPSFNDPYFLQLSRYYQSLGRSLYVLDLTADLRIPAFAAISHRPGVERENIVFGFGAHVDARIGVERALTELNQILPIAAAPGTEAGAGNYLTRDQVFIDWLNNATMENQPYLVPLPHHTRKAADYPPLCRAGINDSLGFCLEAAARRDLDVLVLDLTRRDVEFPVARVFVPGLRHFWKRLAPGRLYDVPVQMGWQEKPLREEETNPLGLFI